ncbi:MAG: HAD family hydrolase [Armatimonadetes bacterium]|nr:MAG: HAD family hydrolase [Armatimonadota bacterium]
MMGAPEVLLDAMDAGASEVGRQVADLASKGRRVLLVATSPHALSDDGALPGDMETAAIVSIVEEIRPDAADTLAYLRSQGVAIKVVSGDNPATVSAIAAAVGLPGAEFAVDMRGHADVTGLAEKHVVFGRVQPEQKRALVRDLQANGHTVAMTGDGVNDVLAIKQSDIGIAMDTAGSATRAVSQLVLLDGRYDRLPSVLSEGRRVIANMERASALFITKTVYAILLAVSVSAAGFVFPFLPRHLTLVGTLTIGAPAFILSFWPSDSPARPGFLSRTLRFSVPAGLVAALVTFSIYAVARSSFIGATTPEAQTAATLTLALVGFWILYRLVRPLDAAEAALIGSMFAMLVLAFTVPFLSDFFALQFPSLVSGLAVAAVTILAIVLLEFVLDMVERHGPRLKWFAIDEI